jgi:hypothetical protein
MPLLLIPLGALVLFALWLVLLPVSLWVRYSTGRAKRRAQGWVVRGNAWLLAVSMPIFLLTAWIAGHWVDDAVYDAVFGLGLGALVGIVSLWTTRFERDQKGLLYTPNRWLVLGLTTLVAVRILAGLWVAWRNMSGDTADTLGLWLEAGAWMGVAGVFLGYGLAYTWGLRARLT